MRGFLFCSANKAVELICVFHFSSDLPAAAHGDLSSLNPKATERINFSLSEELKF